ncbi:AAA family ATPase, partial [Leuconostoc citreum]|uniref:AAA family ATPase n=1 Tax=Leuconostoc citreum TaxID=33964 RepID=UPI0021A2C4DB
MTVTNIKAFIGEPGTGKTYQLTHMVNDLINQGQSIYIMNPTKSARNNVRKAFKEMLEAGDMSYDNYKEAFKSTNVLHGYQDNPSNNIFIDESAMIDLSAFYALLYSTIGMEDVHIYLFGDMKQIEPVNGDSILKTLIQKTMPSDDTRNIWQYVADTLYSDMENIIVDSPEAWKLDSKVNITVF